MEADRGESERTGDAPATKTVAIALQGGAVHGAFGWGALDYLLEDGRLRIAGVSGTSSGAINAALLAYGLTPDVGPSARSVLERFWMRMSEESERRRWTAHLLLRLLRLRVLQVTRKSVFFDVMSRILLPYDFDPKTMSPLRDVIDEHIDFPALRDNPGIKLFLNATNIATVKNRVFKREEVTLDAVCASCCLPFLFDAVEIDGEHYWDGGYMGNPTIYPLIYDCDTADILLILTAPLSDRPEPTNAADILARISEVSFTSTLMREMRAISFVTGLLDKGMVTEEAGLRRINIHLIAPPMGHPDFDIDQRFNAGWPFVQGLRDHGRAAAKAWLEDAYDRVGVASTFEIDDTFV